VGAVVAVTHCTLQLGRLGGNDVIDALSAFPRGNRVESPGEPACPFGIEDWTATERGRPVSHGRPTSDAPRFCMHLETMIMRLSRG
jgi:hypothetical protein